MRFQLGNILFVVVVAAAATACGDMKKSKRNEAELQLQKLQKGLEYAVQNNGAFPVGQVGPTPAETCCAPGGSGKCTPSPGMWMDPIWEELAFSMDDPHYYTYAYSGTAEKATVTAYGNLDCDADVVEYVLSATLDAGKPTFALIKPSKSD